MQVSAPMRAVAVAVARAEGGAGASIWLDRGRAERVPLGGRRWCRRWRVSALRVVPVPVCRAGHRAVSAGPMQAVAAALARAEGGTGALPGLD